VFDDPLNLLGLYILAMPVAGFLFGVCSACCDEGCRTFEDNFEIAVGRLVSWGNSTPAFDGDLAPITLSANSGRVLAIADIGGFLYALVEYEDGVTKTAWIAFSDLTKEIDDWWEVCSGGWEIDGGILKSTSDGVMTFLITEPTPYGIFTALMYWIEGVEYLIYVRKGDDSEDKCGLPDQTIKFVPTGNVGEWKIYADGELRDEIYETQGSAFARNGVCVDEKGVAVIVDEIRRYQVCSVPGGYYFAIGAGGAGTEWDQVEYSDHYDHNTNCPRCQPPCCFQNYTETIRGFDIRITNISSGINCACPDELEVYVPLVVNGVCECAQTVSQEVSFPGGDFGVCQTSDLALSLVCDTQRIDLGVTLTPRETTGVEWIFQFSPGTAPGSVSVAGGSPFGAGDDSVCDFSTSLITITPRLTTGCCGGEPASDENPFP
jgi:hypothetical protein